MKIGAPKAETCTLRVPFRVVKRGGRKELHLPKCGSTREKVDNTLIKALSRAFRWRQMLESGEVATINELAASEGISPSYLTRLLQLTLLAPEFIENVVDGRHGNLSLQDLRGQLPLDWDEQKRLIAAFCGAR